MDCHTLDMADNIMLQGGIEDFGNGGGVVQVMLTTQHECIPCTLVTFLTGAPPPDVCYPTEATLMSKGSATHCAQIGHVLAILSF